MSDTIEKQKRFVKSMWDNKVDHELFVPTSEMSARLNVYRRNYMQGLCELLKSKFPVTTTYLGSKFQKNAMEYVLRNPPKLSGQFALYGDAFSNFLECDIAQGLAKLEWLFQKVIMAQEEEVPDGPKMPPEEISWQRRGDIFISAFDCDILGVYETLKANGSTLPPKAEKQYVVLSRQDDTAGVKLISAESYKVLEELQSPHTIDELSEKLTFSQTVWRTIFSDVFNPQLIKVAHGIYSNSGSMV